MSLFSIIKKTLDIILYSIEQISVHLLSHIRVFSHEIIVDFQSMIGVNVILVMPVILTSGGGDQKE